MPGEGAAKSNETGDCDTGQALRGEVEGTGAYHTGGKKTQRGFDTGLQDDDG